MSKNWYCLRVTANREKSFKLQLEALKEKLKSQGSSPDQFGEVFMPSEEVVEMRKGKRVVSQRKFYPNYVFIEMEMNPQNWNLINRLPMTKGFVGDPGTRTSWQEPQPISDAEINKIRSFVAEGSEKPKPKVMFAEGEAVRIKDGPFTNFTGNVIDVNYESNRISVSVNVFSRPTEIQIDFEQVEKM